MTTTTINLAHIRPLDHRTAVQLGAKEHELMAKLLRSLDAAEWDAPTDCDLWSVRDIVAHQTGWAAFLSSPREAGHQMLAAVSKKRDFDAFTHAQNQIQVEDRRKLSPSELLDLYEETSMRSLRARGVLGVIGKGVPLYVPFIGGFLTMGYLLDTIFTRDTFMHRIDISRATGRELEMGLQQEVLITDVVRDWAKSAGIPVRVELEGPSGGVFSHHEPRVTVRTTSVDFCRFNAGRAGEEVLEVEGSAPDIRKALAARAPF